MVPLVLSSLSLDTNLIFHPLISVENRPKVRRGRALTDTTSESPKKKKKSKEDYEAAGRGSIADVPSFFHPSPSPIFDFERA